MAFKSVTEVDIDVPRTKLASLFADPSNFTRWMDDMERIEPISGEMGMPGSRFRMVPKMGDRSFIATVIERDLPSAVDLELDAPNLSIATTAKFTPLSAATTRLRHEQVFRFRGIMPRLFGALSHRSMRRAQERHMRGLKRFAEASLAPG
jgi:hypothetical protein